MFHGIPWNFFEVPWIPWNLISLIFKKNHIDKYCCWYLIGDYMLFVTSHINAIYCIDFNIVIRILNTPVSAKMAQGQRKWHAVNSLRPRQNGRYFPDDIFKCIFLNENVWITIKISLKFVPKGPINNIPALVQIMAWRRPGDKPLSEALMDNLPTHICITRPQWVNNSLRL